MKHCPKCFASTEEAGFACTSPQCSRAGIPVAAADLDASGKGAPLCPACQSAMTVKVCRECGFELDAAVRQSQFLSYSLVGAHGVGKSNFLAMLLQQLGSEFCKVYGSTLYPTGGDRTMDHYERHYRRPLFDQGICVPPTREEDVDPLTYTLVFPPDSQAGKTCGLAFYDACGKNFLSEAEMALHNRSIYHSDGILFLLDPTQLPVLRGARRGKGQRMVKDDAQALLLRTVHLLRTGLGMENVDKKLPVPLVVCLTKLDTFTDHLDPASFIRDGSRNLRRPMVSSADLNSCSLEVQSLIESWGGGEFLGHVNSQFAQTAFFALSALGGQPGEQNEIPRVAPHRVLDPLLWLLWKKQILRAG